MRTFILLLTLLTATPFYAQNDKTPFEAHQNLIGGTWHLDAKWGDGTPHLLDITYKSSLNGKLLKTTTYGNVSKTGYERGLRNEGIRAFDATNTTMVFYEFDVFGGITKGEIKYRNKDIYYTYSYGVGDQQMTITDQWQYVDNDTYNYTIGVYNFETQTWDQQFLYSKIVRITD